MTAALCPPVAIVARASCKAAPSARDEKGELVADGSERRERMKTARNSGSDIVDMWGHHSFPASDPPANW